MLGALINAWRVPDLRKKILYTALLLFVYRLGSFIPVPGVNTASFVAEFQRLAGETGVGLLSLLDMFSGGGLSRATVFALNVGPYITASIIIELLAVVIPIVAVLLAAALLIRKRLTVVETRTLAIASVVLFAIALAVYLPFRDFTRTYIYRFPPASATHEGQTRHIRGDLHERGVERVKDMTIAQAVYELGGPDQVNAMGSLWHEQSRSAVIGRMERYYIALIMLLTVAIFVAGLTVWRQQQK